MNTVSLRRRSLKVLISLAAAFALTGASAGAAGAQTAARLPLQGVYEGCNSPVMQTDCIQRLQNIKDMGFNAVLNYTAFSAHVPDLQAYMAAAQRIGIKLIWSFKDPYWWTSQPAAPSLGQLNSACGCTTDDQLLQFIVNLVKDSPATWGYYVGDETSPDQAGAQKAFSDRLHQLDPNHPRLFVGIGDYNGVQADIAPFKDSADVLGADFYPVGLNRPLSQVQDVSQRMSNYAQSVGKQSAMVLQAFNWNLYKDSSFAPASSWPTRQQMRQMRDYAIAGGADDLILWFNYYKMAQQPNATSLFSDLSWAANGDGPVPASGSASASTPATTSTPAASRTATASLPAATAPLVAPTVANPSAATAPGFVALRSAPQVQVKVSAPRLSGHSALTLGHVRCTAACTLTLAFTPASGAQSASTAKALRRQQLKLGGQKAGTVVARGRTAAVNRLRSGKGRVRVAVTARIRGRATRSSYVVGGDGRLTLG